MPQGGRIEKGLQALDAALGETGGTRLETGLAALDAALGGEQAAPTSLFGAEEHGRLPSPGPGFTGQSQEFVGEPGSARARSQRAEAAEQQRLAATPAEPSLGEKVSSAATDAWGGLVDFVLSMPEAAGRVAQGSAEQIRTPRMPTARGRRDYSKPQAPVGPSEAQETAAGWLEQSGNFLVALAQEGKKDIPAPDPRVADSFLFGTLPRGLGQIAGAITTAGAGGVAAAGASSMAYGGTSLMAQVESELAPRVQAGEMSPEEAQERGWTAFAAGLALGLPDALSIGSMLWRADKATGGGVRKALMAVLTGMATEGATEALQTGGEQATLAWLTDSERGVLERLGEVGEAGAAGGVIGGLVTMALLGARGAGRLMSARPGEVVAPATEQPVAPVEAPQEAQEASPEPVVAPAATAPVAPVEPPLAPVPLEQEGAGGTEPVGGAEPTATSPLLPPEATVSPEATTVSPAPDDAQTTPSQAPKLVPRQLTLADPDTDPELVADAVEKAQMGDHAAMPASGRTAPPPDPNGIFKPIAPRLKGAATTATAMPSPGRPISSPQVQDAFARVVEAAGSSVPFRIGRIGQRNARGVFKVGPEVIRIREAGNLTTAAHEMFHALEKALYGFKENPWTSARVGAAGQKELVALGRERYSDTRPAAGYRREGWAEFGRLWLTDNAEARRKAPRLTAWMEATFLPGNPEVATALRQAADAMRQWQVQGPRARTQASIEDPTSPRARLRSIGETLRQTFSKQAWVEMGEPIRQFAERAQQNMGDVLPSSKDPWALYEALRLTHDARAERMVSEAMIDLAGNRVGPSLKQALAPVRGKRAEFTEYLWGRQAQLYWNDPQGRNPGLSREDADALVTELRSPAFELAEGMLREWHEGVLNYAAQASPAFAQVVERVRASHPGYLMPLQRAFDDLDDIWKRAARRSAGQATSRSPVQAMRGSGRRIKEPFQAMISNARAVVLKAHQRAVLDAVIGLSRVEGMGGLVEKVPQDQVPAASRTIEQVLEEIRRKLGPGVDIDIQGADGIDIDNLLGETLTFFAPAQNPKGKDPILPYWNGSSVDWYYVDGGLYRTLAGMDVYRLPAILHWTLGATARAMRLGTTGMNAAFSLITNPQRDFQSLWMQTQSSANAGQLFASWLNQLGRSALGTAIGDKGHSKEMRAWLDMGGAMAQSLGQDIGHTRRAARQLFEGRVVRTIDPRNWIDALREVFNFPESGTRSVEIGRVAKEIGWTPGTPMSLDQSIDLLRAGKRVSTDFSAAGELSRVFNQMVPFLGSSIQGSRAAVRAARHHPARFMFRGMQMAAATLALWWQIKDEEWYEELPARERFGYWHFKVGNEVIRIPRAFEIGAMFSALPEALADAWYRSDPERARQWFGHMFDVVVPPLMPVPVEEALEQAANVDFYNEVPIVPRGELEIPAEEQFGEYTSRAAITLGEVFNISPRRIDHAVRGVFGGVGTDVIEMLGLGPAKLAREDEPADTPILGRLFMRGGTSPYRSESVDKLWGRLEEYTLRQGSRKVEETPEQRAMRLQLSDATKAVSALSWVRAHAKKDEERRRLSVEILKIARDALEAEESGRPDRGRFAGERKRAEGREAAARKAQ